MLRALAPAENRNGGIVLLHIDLDHFKEINDSRGHGAGDALLAAFTHVYARTHDPYVSIQKAMVFASYKIGEASASAGFLDEAGLEALCAP